MSAQIGYQVSLLNNATGEPRANERVTVTVKITDANGQTVCEETKTETSNDFGVISMSIGDSETFANADWSKLPFFIEASVEGRLLGKSQLLSVPVAEHAKHTGTLTRDYLCSRNWEMDTGYTKRNFLFETNGKYHYHRKNEFEDSNYEGSYIIDGNMVFIDNNTHEGFNIFFYCAQWDSLIDIEGDKFSPVFYSN